MKVGINDYRNKGNDNYNKFHFHRKDNMKSHNINYYLYISSSLPKSNKTVQKYINKKLNSINKNNNNLEKEAFTKQNNQKIFQKKKPITLYKRERYINNNQKLKQKFLKEKTINENINRTSISKDDNKSNFIKILNNNNINNYFNYNISEKRNQYSKKSNIINSGSTSAGMSISSNKNKIEENSKISNNIEYNSIGRSSNVIYDRNRVSHRFFLDEHNYCRPKINNSNYETGSDDNFNENIIFLKCDNYSSLTFGNSFSYSNSHRTKSTKRQNNIDENKTNNLTFYCKSNNKNKFYLNKLKEENEALKKELQQSNDQIILLKYQIKELKEVNLKKNSRNSMFPTNLWNKKNIKYEILENRNYNDIKNTKEFSLDLGNIEKTKFNKDFLNKINNTINESDLLGEKRKIINVKKNMNLKKKNHKKSQDIPNDYSSFCFLDKPCEKITECISNLKI